MHLYTYYIAVWIVVTEQRASVCNLRRSMSGIINTAFQHFSSIPLVLIVLTLLIYINTLGQKDSPKNNKEQEKQTTTT